MITWKDLPRKNPADTTILIIEDAVTFIQDSLSGIYRLKTKATAQGAIKSCENELPDLIIIDTELRGMSGFDACKAFKQNLETCDIPVILYTSIAHQADEDKCWQSGCADFIAKPASSQTIANRVKAHIKYKLQADSQKRMTYIDGLTGVYNRHMLNEFLTRNIKLANRTKSATSALLIDVDWFKDYNDFYGREQGDEILKQVVKAIKSNLKRPVDVLIRYGGEEFLGILPDTDLAGARHVANQVVKTLQALKIPHEKAPSGYLTVSIGVTTALPNTDMDGDSLLNSAQQALLEAKNGGKNQATG